MMNHLAHKVATSLCRLDYPKSDLGENHPWIEEYERDALVAVDIIWVEMQKFLMEFKMEYSDPDSGAPLMVPIDLIGWRINELFLRERDESRSGSGTEI